MLKIEKIRLRLPQQYRHRGPDIVRLLGEVLSTLDTAGLRSIDLLTLPPLVVNTHSTNLDIANMAKVQIAKSLGKGND